MIELLRAKRDEIAALCVRFGVGRLDVFGSAADGTWIPGESDIDFLVTFDDRSPGYARRWLTLERELKDLLETPVDLVIDDAIRNPYFRRSVNRQRVSVYERANRNAAA